MLFTFDDINAYCQWQKGIHVNVRQNVQKISDE
jgi:hypothetical protein